METNNATPNLDSQKQSFNFLTEIYDILKCFENNPSKLGSKLNDLKQKFEKARALLTTMPGIDVSLSEQQSYYEDLLKQYKRETELFLSYKDTCKFDLDQLDAPPPPENTTTDDAAATTSTTKSAENADTAAASSMLVDSAEAVPPPPPSSTTTTNDLTPSTASQKN